MLIEMQHALKHTETSHLPMVVVVSAEDLSAAQKALICMAGDKHPFSGRTLHTPRGRLTVRASNETPPSGEYLVAFLSGTDMGAEEMVRWKNAAQQIIIQGM